MTTKLQELRKKAYDAGVAYDLALETWVVTPYTPVEPYLAASKAENDAWCVRYLTTIAYAHGMEKTND